MTTYQKARSALIMAAAIVLATVAGPRAATMTLSPSPYQTVTTSSGAPISGACVWTYTAGTSSAATTYTDKAGSVANQNPIITDVNGHFTAYLAPGSSYKYVYENIPCSAASHGATLWTYDNIDGTPASSAAVDVTGTAGETITAGNVAYLSDGSGGKSAGQWYKADTANAYSSTLPLIGFALSGVTASTTGSFRTSGQVTGLSALTIGADYYITTSGGITLTAPPSRRFVGRADSTTTLVGLDGRPVQTTSFADDFRLSLTTATCETTTDVTAAGTLFWTPCDGNRVTLFDASNNPTTYTSGELSIAVPAAVSQMYDVFIFANSGTPAIELLAWTNDTTRATAIVRINGRWTKSGDPTRLYVGNMRSTTVANQTEDSYAKRYVWNYYNRRVRDLRVRDTTDTWVYNTQTWRCANTVGACVNQLDLIVGVAEVAVSVEVHTTVTVDNVGAGFENAVGYDSTTTPTTGGLYGYALPAVVGAIHRNVATLKHYPAIGRHIYVWLEQGNAVANATWSGDNGGTNFQSGIQGTYQG